LLPKRLSLAPLTCLLAALLVLGACQAPGLAPGETLRTELDLATAEGVHTAEGARLQGSITAEAEPAEGAAPQSRDRALTAAREALRLAARDTLAARASVNEADLEAFEAAVRRELGARGLELVRWSSAGLAVPGAGGLRDQLQPTTDLNVLLIGLDGWDWDIAEPLMAAGRMPTLQGLVDRGTRAKLATIQPILSPVIWTSLATGREPADHGILDFLGSDAAGNAVPVTSNLRKVPAFWNVLSEARVPVGVMAWWASWPAEPVEGFVVSDRVAYQLFGVDDEKLPSAGKVYPPALWDEVGPMVARPSDVGDAELAAFVDASAPLDGFNSQDTQLLEHFRAVVASSRTYSAIGLQLHERVKPRVGAYYFQAPDTAAHLFMRYADPPLPEVDPARQRRFAPVVDRVYEQHDRLLAQYLERIDENTVVMLVSDHGFKTGAQRPTTDSRVEAATAAEWHARFGMFVAAGPGIRRGHELREASVLDIAPTMYALLGMPVAEDLDGRVLEEALEPSFLAEHPLRSLPTYGDLGASAAPAFAEASAEDQAILESLIAIGYVSAPATGASAGGAGSSQPDASGLSANARNNAGTIALSRGELDEAIAEFGEAVELQPGFQLARTNLAHALLQAGRIEDAESQLRQVLLESPDDKKALSLLSDLLAGEGRLAEALPLAEAAVTAAPRSAMAWSQLGRVRELGGDVPAAREAYERAASLDAELPEPLNALGNLAEADGNWALAAKWYARAVDADPGYAPAYNNLALQYQRLGRWDEALEVYERGREKLPGSSILLNNLASWHHQRARAAAREARGGAARPAIARAAQATFEEAADRAEALYREAMAANPLDASPVNNLGGLLGERGDREEQRRLYEAALLINPDYADARHNLADWHVKAGDLAAALIQLDAALAADPRHWRALRLRGAVREQGGDRSGGCADYRSSLALQPQQPLLVTAVAERCSGS
jgi:tetratricopeptide (TPR) repeat protein